MGSEAVIDASGALASDERNAEMRVCSLLVARGQLKEADLARALRLHQEAPEGTLTALLARLGLISEACSTYVPQSLDVDVYVGGPVGAGGTFVGRYLANQSSEAAVAAAGDVSGGSYRYSIQLTPSQRHSYHGEGIYVYGLSPVGGRNNQLTQSGSFTVPAKCGNSTVNAREPLKPLGRLLLHKEVDKVLEFMPLAKYTRELAADSYTKLVSKGVIPSAPPCVQSIR